MIAYNSVRLSSFNKVSRSCLTRCATFDCTWVRDNSLLRKSSGCRALCCSAELVKSEVEPGKVTFGIGMTSKRSAVVSVYVRSIIYQVRMEQLRKEERIARLDQHSKALADEWGSSWLELKSYGFRSPRNDHLVSDQHLDEQWLGGRLPHPMHDCRGP